MSSNFETRIQKVIEILKPYSVAKEDLLTILSSNFGIDESEIGIQILESDSISFEDFQTCFVNLVQKFGPIPRPRLMFAFTTLKETQKKETHVLEALAAMKPIGQWTDLELLEKYNKDCSPEIEEELIKRSKNRPTIIFDGLGTVDVENSLYMLRKARHQETPATMLVLGITKQVYRIGEFPLDMFYECPVHSHILLVDGYCEECGTKWDVNDYERNVFLRLITQSEKIDYRFYREKKTDELISSFPKIFLKFNEMKEEDTLPKLKRKISKTHQGDPFRVVSSHRTY